MDNALKLKESFKAIDYRSSQPICLEVEKGRINKITNISPENDSSVYIAPGLVDLQINGYKGIDFNKADLMAGEVEKVTQLLWQEGVTSYYPTVITNSDENISSLVSTISKACNNPEIGACIGGIHLEGPFISPEDGPRGAHSSRFVKAPDWELFSRWQESANGKIKLVTISPEWIGSTQFIEQCVAAGVIVSIGHTAASPEQIRQAIAAGAKMSTHLGNGCHQLLPRHRNYIWEQLASDELCSSLIADGFHLPVPLLKIFLKVKGKKSILVSDATCFAGLEPGSYSSHIGGEVELNAKGKLFMKESPDMLAGSAQTLPWCINHLVKEEILSLQEAWEMASLRPTQLLYEVPTNGLEIDRPADLVLFKKSENGIKILQTIKSGKIVYTRHQLDHLEDCNYSDN